MKRSHQCAFATLALLVCSSSLASAQTFGEKGQLAISAERLFGYVHDSATTTYNGQDTTVKTDSFSLLSSSLASSAGAGGLFYSQPRVAGDYFVIDRLSVGAALGYSHASVPAGNADATTSWGAWTFAPRAGYVFAFSDMIGIWPRAGFTYRSLSAGNDGAHVLALTIEAPVTFMLIPHVVFTAGPTIDIGLTGSQDHTDAGTGVTNSLDFTATEIGLQTGLVATVW